MKCEAGQVAFITGGASGIGLAIAKSLGAAGMSLVIADIEQGALDGAVAALNAAGADATGVICDVTSRDSVAAARDAALTAYGQVNLLVNNAGVNVGKPVQELTFEDWDWVMGVNLDGVVNGVMLFRDEILRHGAEGHMLSTASVGGLVGMPSLTIYNASKFAVVGLMEALRADLHEAGTGVSVLCPGMVATNLNSGERNRPGVDPASVSAPDEDPLQISGIDPAIVGEKVLAGLRAGEFFIATHPEFRELIAQRNRAVEAAMDGPADPEMAEAMKAIVHPF